MCFSVNISGKYICIARQLQIVYQYNYNGNETLIFCNLADYADYKCVWIHIPLWQQQYYRWFYFGC